MRRLYEDFEDAMTQRILDYLLSKADKQEDYRLTAICIVDDLGYRTFQLSKIKYRLNKLVKQGKVAKEITHRWDSVWTGSQSFFGGYVSCKRKMAYYRLTTEYGGRTS